MPDGGAVRERLWRVTAKRAIFATGAIERPLVFPDNDRPGSCSPRRHRAYLHRYGVAGGRRWRSRPTTIRLPLLET